MVNWMKAAALRAEGSGDVTAFTGLCLDSTGLHRARADNSVKSCQSQRIEKKKD